MITESMLEPLLGHARLPVMDVTTAHLVIQKHRQCLTTNCPIRHQAKIRLVQAKRMVPADWPHM